MNLKGGFTALSYNGTPLTSDKYVPAGEMHCLDMKNWGLYRIEDFDWLDRDGSMFSRVSNKPVWEATLVLYSDIGCDKPKGQVTMSGITEH